MGGLTNMRLRVGLLFKKLDRLTMELQVAVFLKHNPKRVATNRACLPQSYPRLMSPGEGLCM